MAYSKEGTEQEPLPCHGLYYVAACSQCFCAYKTTGGAVDGQRVEVSHCSTPCGGTASQPGNGRTCGGDTAMQVYNVADVTTTSAPCAACPRTQSATGLDYSAKCQGDLYPPYASPGFWASSTNPLGFFKSFKGNCLGGKYHGNREGSGTDLQYCGAGAKGVMCAGCLSNHFKRGKSCTECFDPTWGCIVYLLAPVTMLLGWNPFFKFIIGGGMTPSLLIVTYDIGYLQIVSAIGGYGILWSDQCKAVLRFLPIVNFDSSLLLFDCSMDQPNYLAKWIMFQMLPVFYACHYFGEHFVTKKLKGPENCVPWNTAQKDSLFLLSALYLALNGTILSVFNCEQLEGDKYHLVSSPTIDCGSTQYLTAVGLSFRFVVRPRVQLMLDCLNEGVCRFSTLLAGLS